MSVVVLLVGLWKVLTLNGLVYGVWLVLNRHLALLHHHAFGVVCSALGLELLNIGLACHIAILIVVLL